ncbi:MAG: phosphoribosylformylglycinamidine synthase subunit PurS [Candidatus Omnitrophica bacterium]|nr:phosphoribosylformylglycinamidine synthase subunit PurS [Candidatus Omnitrophota bacterium]
MLEVEVYVSLKKTVSDPQGLAVKRSLESLGYSEVKEVRVGKFIQLRLDLEDREKASQRIEEMCKKLLANPIIEDFTFKIK